MWSTVIRAYRVKSVSSHCETLPMRTSNYCDGISAFLGWKGFNCSSVFFEEGNWMDGRRCEISPWLQRKGASSHFITPTFVSSLVPNSLRQRKQNPRKWRCACQHVLISPRTLQWMSSLLRTRWLHTALFCQALRDCCMIVGLYCLWNSLHLCHFCLTACCFVWDVALPIEVSVSKRVA